MLALNDQGTQIYIWKVKMIRGAQDGPNKDRGEKRIWL